METRFEFKNLTVTNDLENSNNRIVSMNFSNGSKERTITLTGSGKIKEIIKV